MSLLISGCGGGGGDGGGGGGGGNPNDTYTLSATSAAFTATQGGATPAAQTIAVTVVSGNVFIATSQIGTGFSHSFVLTGPTTGRITITPDPPNAPGSFSGTITVRGCASSICGGNDVPGSPKTISVIYAVAAGPALTVSPPSVDFVATVGVTPPTQDVTVTLSAGTLPFSVFADIGPASWLTIGPVPPTITGSQAVTLGITGSLPIAETRSANVTFQAGSMMKVVPVRLTVNSPGVNFVSPYVVTTPVAGSVIIRGYGFPASPTPTVEFGTTAAGSVTVVSDTEIVATLPATLTPGTYQVKVNSLATRANLVVVNPPAFPAATIVRPSPKSHAVNLIYDAERQAVFIMDGDNNRIERYRFASGWTAESVSPGVGGGNNRLALAPDGTELLKTSGSGSLLHRVNPAAMPFTLPGAFMSPPTNVDASTFLGSGSLNLIAFGNDGRAVGSYLAPTTGITLYRYDMLNKTFSALSTQSDMTNRLVVASGDGHTIVLPTFEPLAPGFFKPVVTYDASAGALTSHAGVTTGGTSHASVSRNGSRMILVSSEFSAAQVTTVYDFSGGVFAASLGNLPSDLRGFVISPDGSTAYAYFAGPPSEIRKFDLNTAGLPPVGIPVAVASPGTFFNQMAISPDGGTLFLAGNEQLIIVPAP